MGERTSTTDEHTENVTHVLRCRNNPEREKSIQQLKKALSPQEPHPVYTMLKAGFISWIEEKDYHIDIAQFPTKFRDSAAKGISDQDALGWDAAMKGYLSIEWRNMASMGTNDQAQSHEGRGMQSIRKVLMACFLFSQSMWKARNHVLHGTNENSIQEIRQTEMSEIIELHGNPEFVLAGDRHYCTQPLEALLTRAPSTRRRWLRHMRQSRIKFTTQGDRQTMITRFFCRGA